MTGDDGEGNQGREIPGQAGDDATENREGRRGTFDVMADLIGHL